MSCLSCALRTNGARVLIANTSAASPTLTSSSFSNQLLRLRRSTCCPLWSIAATIAPEVASFSLGIYFSEVVSPATTGICDSSADAAASPPPILVPSLPLLIAMLTASPAADGTVGEGAVPSAPVAASDEDTGSCSASSASPARANRLLAPPCKALSYEA